MTYQVGDTVNPEEPAVGTVLKSSGSSGSFRIRRHHDGWKIEDKRCHTRICWRAVLSAWGPGAGQTLTVVKVP